jgi:hypothetical protein
MINASLLRRPGFTAALDPILVRRRRALRIAPPTMAIANLPVVVPAPTSQSDWRDDLRFFLGCYVAGLVFFLILLS